MFSEGFKRKRQNFYSMDFGRKFSSGKLTSKNLLAGFGVVSLLLMAVGGAMAQGAGTKSVSLGQNGVTVNLGDLSLEGNDIESNGNTIYDSGNGYVPASILDTSGLAGGNLSVNGDALDVDAASIQSGTTASDVGLGNVRNVNLSNTGGSFLTYDTNNEEYNVDGASIQSGTTASDVGLGNVENENALAQDASEVYQGNLSLNKSGHISLIMENSNIRLKALSYEDDGDSSSSQEDTVIRAFGDVMFRSNILNSDGYCRVDESADLECTGNKNWVHDLNSTHEAIYSSQESPEVRAVYEGQVGISDGKVNVSLPSHFSNTVSDSRPSLRVQATPHSLTNVAVTERTDYYLVIKADTQDTVEVDYRVTGIREGYEDKQVVRPKE